MGETVDVNPILMDYCSMNYLSEEEIDAAISSALEAAKSGGVSGKEITPFLLNSIKNITANKSLETSNF